MELERREEMKSEDTTERVRAIYREWADRLGMAGHRPVVEEQEHSPWLGLPIPVYSSACQACGRSIPFPGNPEHKTVPIEPCTGARDGA
jgi:hypothetical protein